MPINEPRIYHAPPKWAHLKEISRTDTEVWFRTGPSSRMMVPLKYVEDWEKRNG